tara:strand:- start:719 stop:955 length:237 start_codon:yes stop_codon:yes gene_type:complete
MLRERRIWCRRAAEEPVIHADRSEHQRSNSQTAGQIGLVQLRLLQVQQKLRSRHFSFGNAAQLTERIVQTSRFWLISN